MKKCILSLTLSVLLLFTGCDKNTPAPNLEDQLAVLAENLSALESEIDWLAYESSAQFAVTDLNDNGLLELVVSSMQGSGLFTYSYYYEVNEAGDGVTQWVQNPEEDTSEADIGVYDVTVYVDESGVRHYLFDDYIRNGYAENWLGLYDVVYGGGTVTPTLLASRNAVIREGTDEFDMTFYDAGGSEITEAEFDAVPDTAFADMEKHTAHIGWALWSDLGDLNNNPALVDQLAASYDGFTIE